MLSEEKENYCNIEMHSILFGIQSTQRYINFINTFITLVSSESKESFFQNGIFLVPQSQTKRQLTLPVRDS